MSESLKRKVEGWSLVVAQTAFPTGLQIVTVDSSEQAEAERLIISAEIGKKNLDGGKEYDATASWELRSTDRNAEAVDAIWATIEAAFRSLTSISYVTTNFSEFTMFPEDAGQEAGRGKNSRTRTYNLPLRVLASS